MDDKSAHVTSSVESNHMSVSDVLKANTEEDHGSGNVSVEGAPKITEDIVNIRNFLLVKRVTENNDKELSLVGTFVQELIGLDIDAESIKLCEETGLDMGSTREDSETLSKSLFFDYRINDQVCEEDSGWIKPRRVMMNSGNAKKSHQLNLPLEVEDYYDGFPYKIVTASVLIELGSSAINDQRRRPNLLLGKDHKATNVAMQTVQHIIEAHDIKNSNNSIREVLTETDFTKKLDKSKSYDFVTPFPQVTYLYDTKRGYCSRFRVTFYMVESGFSKFVKIVFPMLLIAILNTVNVLDRDVESTNFLNNAATFALTAVFILPSVIGNSNSQNILSMNNVYIILVFVGLALSSIPLEMMKTNVPAFTGMIIIWFSFIMPTIGCIGYAKSCYSIRRWLRKIDRFNSEAPKTVTESDLTTVDEANEDLYKANLLEKFIVVHG